MKRKWIYITMFMLLITGIFVIFTLINRADIVSYCVGDANNDGIDEVLFILGDYKKNDKGEKYGNSLNVCSIDYLNDIKHCNIKNIDTIFSENMESIKPMKVMTGDINGDGLKEISLIVYKSTKFHPEMAKRPFFYLLKDDYLEPVWRGSCLSRPFYDYELLDIDEDGIDEIIALEMKSEKEYSIASYSWNAFGFIQDFEISIGDKKACFENDNNVKIGNTQMNLYLLKQREEF